MRYTVTWNKNAENELARIWMQSTIRQAVSDAADEIDRNLAENAHQSSQRFGEQRQLLFIDPLAIYYVIQADDRLVNVLNVWTKPL